MAHGDPQPNDEVPNVPYGTVIGGDFMIIRPLRRGSMGAVYVAEQLSTAVPRALKIMRYDYVRDETLYKRFEREAQVCARIASDHVAQVIAAGVDRKMQLPWIAMELLDGQDLRDHIDEHGPLPPGEVLRVFEQLCHALGCAHDIGVVHRDLKPANIFMTRARRVGAPRLVKILDFGVARIAAEQLTLSGVPLGTMRWMAPEQALGESAVPASDVWSLGLLAFYVLTGRAFWRSPLKKDDDREVLRELCYDPIPIASARALELGVGERIPPGFSEWFALCVARSPAERFANASAAYAALTRSLPTG